MRKKNDQNPRQNVDQSHFPLIVGQYRSLGNGQYFHMTLETRSARVKQQ